MFSDVVKYNQGKGKHLIRKERGKKDDDKRREVRKNQRTWKTVFHP